MGGRDLVQRERLGHGVGVLREAPRPDEGGDGTPRQHVVPPAGAEAKGRHRSHAEDDRRPRPAAAPRGCSSPRTRGVLAEHQDADRRGLRWWQRPRPPGAGGNARGSTSSYREASDARWTAPSKAARATATSPTTTEVGFSQAAADPPSPPTATRPDATPPSTAPSRNGATTDVTDQTRLQALTTPGDDAAAAEDVRDHPQHDGGQHQRPGARPSSTGWSRKLPGRPSTARAASQQEPDVARLPDRPHGVPDQGPGTVALLARRAEQRPEPGPEGGAPEHRVGGDGEPQDDRGGVNHRPPLLPPVRA